MSTIEEAARALVEANARKSELLPELEESASAVAFSHALDAWDEACSRAAEAMAALTRAVHDIDAERERLVKRPTVAGAELLGLDDAGGH